MTIEAARFHAAGDIRIEQVPGPEGNLGARDVLVRPRWCGICGTDLHEYLAGPIVTPAKEHPLTGAKLPQILGHEFSADVIATGSEVTSVEAGDRVAIMPLIFCGECEYCRRGLDPLCTRMGAVGLSWTWGGMADEAVVGEAQVLRLPAEVSYEQGALIEPGAVAMYGVQRGRVGSGDSVLITGIGPIGALTVLACRASGAEEIFVVEPNAKRAARAEELGADIVLDPTAYDAVAEVIERTNGRGVDVALECSGSEGGLRACLGATKARGVVSQVGLHTKDAAIDVMDLAEREIDLVGVWCFAVHDFSKVARQVASGSYPVEQIVTSKIRLQDVVPKGFDALVDPAGNELKILVSPEN
jgi:(R,R)-butanediol dehydrogenase/meso-butanediol dehydrogenase/diacetyl reductase